MRVAGVWQNDRRFGLQVKVARAEPLPPSGETALIAYLRRVKHVGGARAARLLDRYGDGVLDAIDRDPRAALPLARPQPAPHERGRAVLARAALDAHAAPAAGPARA